MAAASQWIGFWPSVSLGKLLRGEMRIHQSVLCRHRLVRPATRGNAPTLREIGPPYRK